MSKQTVPLTRVVSFFIFSFVKKWLFALLSDVLETEASGESGLGPILGCRLKPTASLEVGTLKPFGEPRSVASGRHPEKAKRGHDGRLRERISDEPTGRPETNLQEWTPWTTNPTVAGNARTGNTGLVEPAARHGNASVPYGVGQASESSKRR